MTSPTPRIPRASLREDWSASYLTHWARFFHPADTGPEAAAAKARGPVPERAERRTAALLRLASDPSVHRPGAKMAAWLPAAMSAPIPPPRSWTSAVS